jgi:hypothetical protein
LPTFRFADSLGFGQAAHGDARRPNKLSLFSYIDLEKRVRADRPLPLIRDIANAALKESARKQK